MARFSLGSPPRGNDNAVVALVKAAVALAATSFVLLALLYSGYLNYTDIEGPGAAATDHPFEVDETGRTLRYGAAQLTREGRLWRLHLAGDPTEIGHARGRLTARLFEQLDDQVRDRVTSRYGAWLEEWTAAMLTRWDYRGADEFLPERYRSELASMAAAMPEAQVGRASSYHRLFLYQSFDSLAARLDDMIAEGNVFAISPKRSGGDGGNLMIGRTLRFDLGQATQLDQIITVVRPAGRYPFVSVGWPGLMGVVTGVNIRGLLVALNPARSDEPLEDGSPLPLLLRQVLEEADTLEQAIDMIQHGQFRTAGIVMIADGVSRRSAILELAPRNEDRRVVRGEGDNIVWATDHMVRDVFEGDLQNDWVRRYTSSGYRYDRIGERLADLGSATPESVAALLRDRRGLQTRRLGLGNPNAIDNLGLTQAVVVDLTAMVMWVCEGPSALGRFQAFDLASLLGRPHAAAVPLADLAPDPLLYSEEYRDWLEANKALAHAQSLLGRGFAERALASAQVAHTLAPDVGEIHRLLGDIERELGHHEAALVHYRRYLELVPGRRRDQARVEGIMAELGG